MRASTLYTILTLGMLYLTFSLQTPLIFSQSRQSQHQKLRDFFLKKQSSSSVPGDPIGCHTGNGEKVSSSQAEPGQAINSPVV